MYCPLPLSHPRASLFSIASYSGLQVRRPLSLPFYHASFSVSATGALPVSLFHCKQFQRHVHCLLSRTSRFSIVICSGHCPLSLPLRSTSLFFIANNSGYRCIACSLSRHRFSLLETLTTGALPAEFSCARVYEFVHYRINRISETITIKISCSNCERNFEKRGKGGPTITGYAGLGQDIVMYKKPPPLSWPFGPPVAGYRIKDYTHWECKLFFRDAALQWRAVIDQGYSILGICAIIVSTL